MDAFYLSDYFHGYIEKIKKSFKIKNIVIMLVSGVALSLVLAILFTVVLDSAALPGALTVSVLSLTVISTVSMLIFSRERYLCDLLDRALFLTENKLQRGDYIAMSVLTFISLVLCVFGNAFFVLSASLLFVLMPSLVSVITSAALNSFFKAIGRAWRIGNASIDVLLFGAGAASLIISILAIAIGGAL